MRERMVTSVMYGFWFEFNKKSFFTSCMCTVDFLPLFGPDLVTFPVWR
jgi:hypothetical protein